MTAPTETLAALERLLDDARAVAGNAQHADSLVVRAVELAADLISTAHNTIDRNRAGADGSVPPREALVAARHTLDLAQHISGLLWDWDERGAVL